MTSLKIRIKIAGEYRRKRERVMIYKQIANTSYLLDYSGSRFLIDPVLAPFEEEPRAVARTLSLSEAMDVDAVVATHVSDQSFDAAARRLLPRGIKIFVLDAADRETLAEAGFTNVELLGEKAHFQYVELYRAPAFLGTGAGETKEQPGGVLFFHPVLNPVYVTGLSVWHEEIKQTIRRFKPRVIILGFGCAHSAAGQRISMSAEEVAAVHLTLPRARILVNSPGEGREPEMDCGELKRYVYEHRMESAVFFPQDGEEIRL